MKYQSQSSFKSNRLIYMAGSPESQSERNSKITEYFDLKSTVIANLDQITKSLDNKTMSDPDGSIRTAVDFAKNQINLIQDPGSFYKDKNQESQVLSESKAKLNSIIRIFLDNLPQVTREGLTKKIEIFRQAEYKSKSREIMTKQVQLILASSIEKYFYRDSSIRDNSPILQELRKFSVELANISPDKAGSKFGSLKEFTLYLINEVKRLSTANYATAAEKAALSKTLLDLQTVDLLIKPERKIAPEMQKQNPPSKSPEQPKVPEKLPSSPKSKDQNPDFVNADYKIPNLNNKSNQARVFKLAQNSQTDYLENINSGKMKETVKAKLAYENFLRSYNLFSEAESKQETALLPILAEKLLVSTIDLHRSSTLTPSKNLISFINLNSKSEKTTDIASKK